MGIESPRIRWGIHPELLDYASDGAGRGDRATVRFFYPAGFLSRRKPLSQVLRAFRAVDAGHAQLIIKGQVERQLKPLERAARRDPRIEVILEDLPTDKHLRLFGSGDVCIAPSRWEGLGLHLYESMALGLPVITNDNPPMNEVVVDGDNGLLVASRRRGRATSGIPAYTPSVRALAGAIESALDPALRERLHDGVRTARHRLRWERTVHDLRALIERVGR